MTNNDFRLIKIGQIDIMLIGLEANEKTLVKVLANPSSSLDVVGLRTQILALKEERLKLIEAL